jgi:hypothetical protein
MRLTSSENVSVRRKSTPLQMLIGGVFGAAFGYASMSAVTRLAENGIDNLHIWAFCVAIMLVAIGLVTLGASLSDARLRQAYGIAPDEPDLHHERRTTRLQGAVLVVAGMVMVIPALGPDILPVGRYAAMVIILGLLALETWINWTIYREGDEFARAVIADTSSLTFGIVQMALFVWASAEVFGLAPTASALDLMTALMVIYILCAGIVTVRRGLAVG